MQTEMKIHKIHIAIQYSIKSGVSLSMVLDSIPVIWSVFIHLERGNIYKLIHVAC